MKQKRSIYHIKLLQVILFLVSPLIDSFTSVVVVVVAPKSKSINSLQNTKLYAGNIEKDISSRRQLLSTLSTAVLSSSASLVLNPTQSYASDEVISIKPCPSKQNSNKNCISTSNIKQLENYMAPWTFEVTPEEAFARIKGVIASDATFTVIQMDSDTMYIKAETRRSRGIADQFEFLINPADKVVVFRSGQKGIDAEEDNIDGFSDFGANRKRLETIRKKGAVFDVMGGGLTMDTFYKDQKGGNGPLGQLKSFYGIQSGKGFEEIVLE